MLREKPALALLVVGLLLLPGPAYGAGLEALDDPDRTRSPTGYVATPIDGANDTVMVDRYGRQVAFRIDELQYRDEYRAPNRTRAVLVDAMGNETVRATDPDVRADLDRIERTHAFVTADEQPYYDLVLTERDGATRVRATRASTAEVAAVVRDERVVAYENLTPAERATFRKIRDATTSGEEYDAYRPWSDEPMPPSPVVRKDGTYYAVRGVLHVDDFGFPTWLYAGIAASVLGVLCLLGAAGVVGHRRLFGDAE